MTKTRQVPLTILPFYKEQTVRGEDIWYNKYVVGGKFLLATLAEARESRGLNLCHVVSMRWSFSCPSWNFPCATCIPSPSYRSVLETGGKWKLDAVTRFPTFITGQCLVLQVTWMLWARDHGISNFSRRYTCSVTSLLGTFAGWECDTKLIKECLEHKIHSQNQDETSTTPANKGNPESRHSSWIDGKFTDKAYESAI